MWIGKAKWEWLRRMLDSKQRIVEYYQEYSRGALVRAERSEQRCADLSEELRLLRATAAQATAALRETDLLRTRVNALELERAALLTSLLPGLNLTVPQIGRLDMSLGAPGTDFEDLGSDDPPPDEIPLPEIRDRETIQDEIGELDDPALRTGTVVDTRRPPTE